MYTIVFSEDAKKDLKALQRKAPQALSKLARLLDELKEHPRTGTGQVEALKGYDVYRIYEDTVEVLVLSAFGHYK